MEKDTLKGCGPVTGYEGTRSWSTMDAEQAVIWTVEKQKAPQLARQAGGPAVLYALSIGADFGSPARGPAAPNGSALWQRLQTGVGAGGMSAPAIHSDAALLWLVIWHGLSRDASDRLVRGARCRPDWGAEINTETWRREYREEREATVISYEYVTDSRVRGRVRVEERLVDLDVNGGEQLKAAQVAYLAWHDALLELWRLCYVTDYGLGVSVMPPVVQRRPWQTARVVARGNTIIDGAEREGFRKAAAGGATPQVLALAYGLTLKQAGNVKKGMRRRGELGPVATTSSG